MKKRSWKKLMGFSLVIALIVLVGCQALGNLDLNKTLVDALLAKSQMSKLAVTLDLKLDESKLSGSDEDTSMLKMLSHIKLNLDQIKQESFETSSVKGNLEIIGKTIPFEAYVSPTLLILKLEGAKKPLVLDLAGNAGDTDALLALGIEKDILEQFTKKLANDTNLHKAILGYFINGMPNPAGITLDNVTESVYGESLALNHVHAEIDGSQVMALVKKFVVNLLQDDKGLRDLVAQFYDVVQPVLIAVFDGMDKKEAEADLEAPVADAPALDELGEPVYDDSQDGEFMPGDLSGGSSFSEDPFTSGALKGLESVLRDRTMGIEFLHTEVKQVLVVLMVALEGITESKDPMIDKILSKNSYLKADLYIDNSGKLRKTLAELNIAPPIEENEGVESVKLTFESEHWNINEPVIADLIDSTDSYAMESITKPAEILAILDPNSELYHLLKDDFKITKKSIVLNMYNAAYVPYSMLPYIEKGVTMVPARFISEQLDADVTFDAATQEVTVEDAAAGNKIILTMQSDKAIWNGKSVKLDGAVRNRDGTTYVPLKFIASALGATVVWDDETKTITIARD